MKSRLLAALGYAALFVLTCILATAALLFGPAVSLLWGAP